jgi:hypothetical protein
MCGTGESVSLKINHRRRLLLEIELEREKRFLQPKKENSNKSNFNFLGEKTEKNPNSSSRVSVEAGKRGIELDSFSKLPE